MRRYSNNFKITMTVLSVFFVCFIWGNSLLPGTESGNLSGNVLNFVNSFLKKVGINKEVSHYMIRKAAHFTEHMCFGACLLVTLRAYTQEVLKYISNILFIGLLVPVIDEFIQLFIDGRGGEIKDVIIDFSGLLVGIIISFIIVFLIDRKNKSKLKLVVRRR